MITITQEIRDMFHTDSDVEDYANEHNLPCGELFLAVSLFDYAGTPCEGCKNVELHRMFPCVSCSRDKKDYFESVDSPAKVKEGVSISVKSLYEHFGKNLTYGSIHTEDGRYYDLETQFSGVVCEDGDICTILKKKDGIVLLMNNDGGVVTTFPLTEEEFAIASFGQAENQEEAGVK